MVYSDLDGTLLDHHNYSFAAAQRSLALLASANFPLLLNTSKTFSEVISLRHQLDNHHPFIIENGSAICIPANYFVWLDGMLSTQLYAGEQRYFIQNLGPNYSNIIKVLHQLRKQHGYQFTGFADMSDADVADCTSLPLADAQMAKRRQASEPMLWQDSDAALTQLKLQLKPLGLKVLKGGRFLHVMGHVDKSTALDWLQPHFARKYAQFKQITVALGDSQNDLCMLERADIGVVIPDAKNQRLSPVGKQIKFASQQGPEGWDAVMYPLILDIINSLPEKEFMHG
ncbi:HAD-IIB family hydrolase [Corallincola holothuriorum]|uniref:HAD-IIB family hydrolase n=1 Tax=Corallincola holothuriorum TaxID=2282215 RepID=UPI0022784457|nr:MULTISPECIES: HAD-IIB family hydrolase [Corallincola]